MSHQGPPGGGYQEPPYDPPSDPWGGPDGDAWRDPTLPQRDYQESSSYHTSDPGYGPAGPAWEPSRAEPGLAPPPERRGNTLLFVAVGMLVLVIAGAVGYAVYLLSGDEDDPAGASGGAATPPAAVAPSGTPEPLPTQDNIGLNAATAQAGNCLTNLGTDLEPQLQVVACEDDQDGPVYEVLQRFDVPVEGADREEQDASAQETCNGVEDYSHHYFEVSPSISFVLCMAQR